MTDKASATASDNAENETVTDDESNANASGHMIPKSRLDGEIAKRRAAEETLAKFADDLLEEVPEEMRDLVPALQPADKIAWIRMAKSKGVFAKAANKDADQGAGKPERPETPKVPATENGRTGNGHAPDLSTLPPAARMARAYGTKQ